MEFSNMWICLWYEFSSISRKFPQSFNALSNFSVSVSKKDECDPEYPGLIGPIISLMYWEESKKKFKSLS
jgi:hypothetical protein